MATYFRFGGRAQDWVSRQTASGNVAAAGGTPIKFYTAASGGSQVTDLKNAASVALTAPYAVTSNSDGTMPVFFSQLSQLWADGGGAERVLLEAWAGDVNPATYKAVVVVPAGTGVQATDDAALDAAVALVATNGIVELTQAGTYAFGPHSFTKAFTLDLNGATINADPTTSGTNGAPLFYWAATPGTQYAFQNPTVGAVTVTTVTAADAGNFAAGDYVILEDQLSVNKWDGSGASYSGRGEMNRVVSANAGTGVITLATPVEWAYASVNRIAKVTPLHGPKIINAGRIVESDPGGTFSGTLTGAAVPHIIHFEYCISPRVERCRIDSWNVQAINFHYCLDPRAVDNQGADPFRPDQGGHGIFVRFDRCHGGDAANNKTFSARHTVDHVTTYDCGSHDNTAYYSQYSAYLTHGLGAKRIKSVNDKVVGATANCVGWGHGNDSFAADYGYMVVNPSYSGAGWPAAQGSGSTDMGIINPDFHSLSYGIIQAQGAKRLKIRNGVVELMTNTGGPYHVRSMQKANAGDATGLAPTDISIKGTTFLDAGSGRVVTTTENVGVVEIEDQALRHEQASARNGHRIYTGIETIDRIDAINSAALTSGVEVYTMFDCPADFSATQIYTKSRGTAASGLTLARLALYSVDRAGLLTSLATTVSDTALWAATFTGYTKNLSATVAMRAGMRYAVGIIATGTTMPALYSLSISAPDLDLLPRPCAQVSSLSDLQASVANAGLTAGVAQYYAKLL